MSNTDKQELLGIIEEIKDTHSNMLSYLYGYMVGAIGMPMLRRAKILEFMDNRTDRLNKLFLSLEGVDRHHGM